MVEAPGWGQQQFDQSLDNLDSLVNLRRLVRPGSLVILLSDFRGLDEVARSHLIRLRQHNEIIMAHIYDPLEQQLPPAGRYRMTNGKQELELDTHNVELIQRYQNKFDQQQTALLDLARRHHINFLSCRTIDEPEKILREGLRIR